MEPVDPVIRRLLLAVVAGVAALTALVALLVPYHDTDALLYGAWSRDMAAGEGFHADGTPTLLFNRPLFYVLQAGLWAISFDERLGRLLALVFAALLLWAVMRLAGGGSRAPVAGVALLAIPDVVRYAGAGLTDVPAAALVALVAVALWREPPWRVLPLLIGLAAAAAVLAKPTALPALAGLALAHLVGPREGLRERVLTGVAPLAIGVALALGFDALEARRAGLSLADFLRSGSDGLFGELSDQLRREAILSLGWIGPYLRLPLVFALVYAALRALGAEHRRGVPIALAAALVAGLALPMAARSGDGVAVGLLSSDNPGARVGSAALAVLLGLGRWAPASAIPDRLALTRALVWATPAVVAWAAGAPYYTRFLAPAWPPLVLLMAAVLAAGLAGAAARHRALAAAGAAVLCALALLDLRNLDSIGSRPDGTINAARVFGEGVGVGDLLDAEAMRRVADPALAGSLSATRELAGPRGRVVATDARFDFFFGDRVRVGVPVRCGELRGIDAFLLLTERTRLGDPTRLAGLTARERLINDPDGPVNPAFWSRCRDPRVRVAVARPGAYVLFGVEEAR